MVTDDDGQACLNLLPNRKHYLVPINSFLSWTALRPKFVEFLANFVDCIAICKTLIMEKQKMNYSSNMQG